METGTEELRIITCTASKSIQLFSDRKTVSVSEKRWHLPRRLFELLEHFVLYGNKVFTREELLKDLWGNEVVGDRLIESHMWCLRQFFTRSRAPCRVETVRGIQAGYWFAEDESQNPPIELSFQKGTGGAISLDIRRRLMRDGTYLRTLEYSMLGLLLKVFVDHFAQILPRQRIAMLLPSSRRERQLRTVNMHVVRLRMCLPGTDYKIETVQGKGFRFVDTSLAG